MKSILFPDAEAIIVRTYSVADIIKNWKRDYGIDVSRFFEGISEIHEYQCSSTGLYFYTSESCAGDSSFYKDMMAFPWYYIADKWEYKKALKILKTGDKVLEIGSGEGAFLNQCKANNINGIGLELNDAAVLNAQKSGLLVENEDVINYAVHHQNKFDAVVSFQVLEHIPNPAPFIKACVDCIKPGGRFICSVPNADISLIRKHNLLNAPPHHMLGWKKESFQALEILFPIKIIDIFNEPIADIHIGWYLGIKQQQHFLARQWLRVPAFKKLTEFVIKYGGNRWIKGHSHMAVFTKL